MLILACEKGISQIHWLDIVAINEYAKIIKLFQTVQDLLPVLLVALGGQTGGLSRLIIGNSSKVAKQMDFCLL